MREGATRIALAGMLAVLAAGCGIDPLADSAPQPLLSAGRAQRERQLNEDWQNHTLRELVDRWGPPWRMLEIPGGGNPPGFIMVYPRDEGTGCLDTFSIMYGPVTRVRGYQCR